MIAGSHDAFLKLVPMRDKLVGMTTLHEQAYVQWLGQEANLSQGLAVELGCWLGSLTLPLLEGLARNPTHADRSKPWLHTFDQFLWWPEFDRFVRHTHLAGRFQENQSFFDFFMDQMLSWDGMVQTHQVDLATYEWSGRPIALLIVDAWKYPAVIQRSFQSFLPHLHPGAILFLRDWYWVTDTAMHVAMYRLRDYFQLLYRVPEPASSASFQLMRPLPRDLDFPGSIHEIGEDELHAAFEWSFNLAEGLDRLCVRIGQGWLHAKRGELNHARACIDWVKDQPGHTHPKVQWLRDTLQERGLGAALGWS